MHLNLADIVKDSSLRQGVELEFWKSVYKTDGCWYWNAGFHRSGYGEFVYRPIPEEMVVVQAHRLGYFLQNNKDPGKLLVCHHCDNKRCVRGDHLFLGTQADNMKDYSEKYQAKKKAGEKNV